MLGEGYTYRLRLDVVTLNAFFRPGTAFVSYIIFVLYIISLEFVSALGALRACVAGCIGYTYSCLMKIWETRINMNILHYLHDDMGLILYSSPNS